MPAVDGTSLSLRANSTREMPPRERTRRIMADSKSDTACSFFSTFAHGRSFSHTNDCSSGSGRPLVSGMKATTTSPNKNVNDKSDNASGSGSSLFT